MKARELIELYIKGDINGSDLIDDKVEVVIDYKKDLNVNNLKDFRTKEEFIEVMEDDESINDLKNNSEWDLLENLIIKACDGNCKEAYKVFNWFEDGSYNDETGYVGDLVEDMLDYIKSNGYIELKFINVPNSKITQ